MERSPYPVAELPPAFAVPPPPAGPAVHASAMELPAAGTAAAEEASGVWDWGTLLDFTLEEDDPLIISWAQDDRLLPDPAPVPPVTPIPPPPPPPLQESSPGSSIRARTAATAGAPSRVRKRDQRLTCENYLAGRVPCACPELDKMDEEEEAEATGAIAGGGRKRVRVGGEAAIARCQVPGCGADIRELKGYHRRHRVCLRCANASSVFLDGESKRYCQQCGKFHILPDFDEGKRSCRRKLERHNKRRRRRFVDHKNIVEGEKESLGNLPADAAYDEEPTKANIELSNEIVCGVDSISTGNTAADTETSLEPEDGEGSPGLSVPSLHTVQSNSVVSFAALHEPQMEERVDNTKSAISSSFCGAHSSLCPTGRVSFKLYDWNPADFPRRLRHQIFQWLASMPVELEGYIRPGCTILTLFIAMPQFMWDKLSEESMVYVNDLVKAPESLLSGRGNILIYLNNKIFQVLKDGTLLANVQMEVQVPRLHYVHPNCFEAGKPIEFIACGSNLLRHKFRFLVSFAGRYLHNEFCGVVSYGVIKSCHEIGDDLLSSEHQMLMIRVNTEPDIFGPAFIEVENECGISNFIPVLFGSQSVCAEMVKLQGSVGDAFYSDIISQTADSGAIPLLCKHLVSSQTSTSDLLLDIAWFLKEPTSDQNEMFSNSTHIQRLNCLLKHLLLNGSFSILEEVLHYFCASMKGKDLNELTSSVCDTDFVCFLNYVNDTRKLVHQKGQLNGRSELDSEKSSDKGSYGHHSNLKPCAPYSMGSISKNGKAKTVTHRPAVIEHASKCCEEDVALLNKDICHRTDCYPHLASEWQQEPWFHILSRRISSTRLAVFIMVTVVMCCGICVALLHPHKAGDFVVMVRRSVWWIGQS